MTRSSAVVAASLALCAAASAAPPAVSPARVGLAGPAAGAQLIVGAAADLTRTARYAVTDPGVLSVSPLGRVTGLRAGSTTVAVTVAGETTTVPVTVGPGSDRVNFPNHVVPVLTKLGCNAGGCHGKQSGQAGFRVSLLGFDPEFDYMTLVKEGRGRRMFPAAPDESLFLTKATGKAPHGGGKKLDPDSDDYRLLRRWVAAGTPYGLASDPVVTRISVFPDVRTLSPRGEQQLAVTAHYSDGATEDVTRQAQFDTNDRDTAAVTPDGLVAAQGRSGPAAVMARYSGQLAVFRAVVPRPGPRPDVAFTPRNFVDTHTAAQWAALNLAPSPPATDAAFLRRVSLDLTGALPTPDEVTAYLADTGADKREKLVDRLLASPGFADVFATKWADLLRVKRRGEPERAAGTFAFHAWIRDAVAADLPYDQFVTRVLTATGTEGKNPPVVWVKEFDRPDQYVDDVGQVFLGQRLACAQCHHHPYEKWGQDDYWNLAAFFGRVGRKKLDVPLTDLSNQRRERGDAVYVKSAGSVTNRRANRPALLAVLGGRPVTVPAGDDPRAVLADWVTAPDNPFFARAVANRYWAHFFGRGIVDPVDDLRATNPPSNPALLDALAAHLVSEKFSLKRLTRAIVLSGTYGLSSEPTAFNRDDRHAFARYYPKRLPAEVLLDAVNRVTDSPANFRALPTDKHAPARAVSLPDESYTNYFLEVFGKPARTSACECERVSEANLAQVLHLLNSDEVQGKLTRAGGRAHRLALDPRPDAEKVDELFLAAFGRPATAADRAKALAHLTGATPGAKAAPREAWENLVWAVLNSKEFLFAR